MGGGFGRHFRLSQLGDPEGGPGSAFSDSNCYRAVELARECLKRKVARGLTARRRDVVNASRSEFEMRDMQSRR